MVGYQIRIQDSTWRRRLHTEPRRLGITPLCKQDPGLLPARTSPPTECWKTQTAVLRFIPLYGKTPYARLIIQESRAMHFIVFINPWQPGFFIRLPKLLPQSLRLAGHPMASSDLYSEVGQRRTRLCYFTAHYVPF